MTVAYDAAMLRLTPVLALATILSFACSKEFRSDMPRENKWGQSGDNTPDPAVMPMEDETFPAAPAEAVEVGPRENPQYHLRIANISNQPLEFVMMRPVSHDVAGWYVEKQAQLVAEGPDFKTYLVPGVAYKLAPRASILMRVFNGPLTLQWVIKLDKDKKKWLRGLISAKVPDDKGVDIPNGIKDQLDSMQGAAE